MQALLRNATSIGAGFLIAHGVTDGNTATAIAGGVVAAVAFVWSKIYHRYLENTAYAQGADAILKGLDGDDGARKA